MGQDASLLRALVLALVRRERVLVLVRVALQAWLLGVALVAVVLLAPALRWERPTSVAVLVLLGGVGAWALVAAPLLLRWVQAGDVHRQAALVEAKTPALRGRLVTAMERLAGPVGQESELLLGLLLRNAARLSQGTRPESIHSGRPLIGLAVMAVLASLIPPIVGVGVSESVGQTAQWWLGSRSALAAAVGAGEGDQGPEARLGDLILRYTYPAYTGLEPREVPNSTGEAYGPPGTLVQVVARSAEVVEAGALVAYDEPPLEATVGEGGRTLTGLFTILEADGEYRLITYQGGEPKESQAFPIRPEADLAPEVVINGPVDVLEVALDEVLPLGWAARDDYGISRVTLEIDSTERSRLASPPDRRAEMTGSLVDKGLRPVDLGLSPGDRVQLVIAAWDNDAVSGSKAGRSQPLEVLVLGAEGEGPEQDARQIALRDAFLTLLADFLEESWPPGGRSGDLASWGERVGERYRRLDSLLDGAMGRSVMRDPLTSRVVVQVQQSGGELIRYTQVAFAPGSRMEVSTSSLSAVDDLRDTALTDLEDGILLLDRAVRNRALSWLVERSQEAVQLADEMRRMLEDDPDPQALLSRLDQVEAMLQEMREKAARLRSGGLQELIMQRTDEMQSLIDEAREALSQGDVERAQELMNRLADRMQEMSESIQDQLEAQQSDEQETQDTIQELLDELKSLEEDQNALQEQVSERRRGQDEQAAAEADRMWAELDRRADKLVSDGTRLKLEVIQARAPFNEQKVIEEGSLRSRRLQGAVHARDIRGGLDAAQWTQLGWDLAVRRLRRGSSGAAVARRAQGLNEQTTAIDRLLRELLQNATSASMGSSDPEMQQIAEQQRALEERVESARRTSRQVVQEMEVQPRGLEEGLKDAAGQMDQASQDLDSGQLMPAEGLQSASAQRIGEARRALEEALQQSQASGTQQQQGEQESGKDPKDSSQQMSARQVEIPPPEDFQTPEAYRQALLQGMRGEVPEEYRAMKKRYYEELVRQ